MNLHALSCSMNYGDVRSGHFTADSSVLAQCTRNTGRYLIDFVRLGIHHFADISRNWRTRAISELEE